MLKDVCISFKSKIGGQTLLLKLETTDTSQMDVLGTIDRGRFYEHETSMLLLRAMNPGDVFIDIGANVGYFTVLAGKLVGPAGHVFSIEMNPRHHQPIRDNLALNSLDATLIPIAVGREKGEMCFADGGEKDGNGTLLVSSRTETVAVDRVEVDTLDNLAMTHHRLGSAKAIKIDVEGAEGWVLMGARKLLRSEQLEVVIVEANPPLQRHEFGVSFEVIRQIMWSNGFQAYILSETGQLPLHVPADVEIQFRLVANVAFLRPRVVPRYWPTVACAPARAIFKY